MGLETGTYLNDLNAANPVGATDPKSEGDNHIRLIKSTLQATFPGMAGRAFRNQAKSADYALAATDNITVITFSTASTLSGNASTLGSGFMVLVRNASTGSVTLPDSSTLGANEETVVASNGTSWLTYKFRLPKYTFHVTRNGTDQTSITADTWTKINWTTEVIDSAGCFDSATNDRYTPTSARTMMVWLSVYGNPASVGDQLIAGIYKNGSIVAGIPFRQVTAGSAMCAVTSALVSCNGSTDYIEGYVYIAGSTSRTLYGDVAQTYMYGYAVA